MLWLYNSVVVLCLIFPCLFYRGWINGLGTIGKSTGAGAVMLIIAFCLSVCAVATIIMLIKVGIPHPVESSSFKYRSMY